MVRSVNRVHARKFLDQAEEFLLSAKETMAISRYSVSTFNAIQAMINANDALTIHHLERRGSADHREAVDLHLDVVRRINDGSMKERFKDALNLRSNAGYMGDAISKSDAERTLRSAILFIEWVKRNVK